MKPLFLFLLGSILFWAPAQRATGQDLSLDTPNHLQEFQQKPTPAEQLDFFYGNNHRYATHSPYDWLDVVTARYNTATMRSDSTGIRIYLTLQAELYHDIGDYNKSLALAGDLLFDWPDAGMESKGKILDLMDRNYRRLQLYDKQIEVRKQKKELGYTENISFYDIYEDLGMYRQAMRDYVYEKKKDLDETDLYARAVYDNEVGRYLLLDKSASTALTYFRRAHGYMSVYLNDFESIKTEREAGDAARLRAVIEGHIGRAQVQLGQYADALPYLENSIGELRDARDSEGQMLQTENRLTLVEAHLAIGNLKKAREYLDAQGTPQDIGMRLKHNRLWAAYYDQLGDFESEVQYLQRTMRLQDSIDQTRTPLINQQMRTLVVDEQLENSKLEKDALQMDLERNQEIMEEKDMRINLVLISLVFTLLGFTGLVYAYLKNIKNQRLLAEQKHIIEKSLVEKDSLLKEIHHRVKNNLQMVSSLLSLQTKNTRSRAAIEALEEGKTRVKAMALIHQKLYQNDDLSVIEMQGYIESLINSVQSVYRKGAHNINITIDAEGVELDIDRAIPIGLILNELVSNSFKYAFPDPAQEGQIYIHIRKNGQGGFFEYTDNGVGMADDSDERANNSMGIRLMRRLVNQLQSTLNIDKTADGVRFWFDYK